MTHVLRRLSRKVLHGYSMEAVTPKEALKGYLYFELLRFSVLCLVGP